MKQVQPERTPWKTVNCSISTIVLTVHIFWFLSDNCTWKKRVATKPFPSIRVGEGERKRKLNFQNVSSRPKSWIHAPREKAMFMVEGWGRLGRSRNELLYLTAYGRECAWKHEEVKRILGRCGLKKNLPRTNKTVSERVKLKLPIIPTSPRLPRLTEPAKGSDSLTSHKHYNVKCNLL